LASSGLEGLLARAKARNRTLGVTGMLLFAENQFYQWLEGPQDGVEQIWDAIKVDPRHRQVELIDHNLETVRLFGEWDMKFASPDAPLAPLREKATPKRVLPAGLIQFTAELALKGDEAAITGGLEELLSMGEDFLTLHGALVEPTAHLIGDWWLEDRIRASDIAVGLSNMQSAVRRVGLAQVMRIDRRGAPRRVLVAAPPGESHGLGVALVGDAFRRTGWRVTSEFPASAEALAACVKATRYDALNLCLSDVFERAEQILPLADAVRAARAASANPDLIVLAGGRLFESQPDLAAAIGADAVYAGAAEALSQTALQIARAQRDAGSDKVTPPPMH
jgi:methanogenic corrinoid protein MtbC1